jgi:hypothetical protein
MPHVSEAELSIINLYQRCKNFNVLPFAGGILDQPEWILSLFDTIDGVINKVKNKKIEEEQGDLIKEKEKEKLIYGGN